MNLKPATWQAGSGFIPRECTTLAPNGDAQAGLNRKIMSLAKALDLPLLITLDAHMVSKESKFIQDILLQNGNPNGWRFSTTYFQMNTDEAWQQWCEMGLGGFDKEFAEGVDNNTMLAEMIEEDMDLERKIRLPYVNVPLDIKELAPEDKEEQYLQLTLRRIKYHGRMKPTDEYYDRLDEELGVITDNGVVNFLPYFLFLEDVCQDARANGDYVGPGRGSAAGSLLSYLLGITQIDPIERGLSFARFLSQGRINRGKFPDIDLDFGDPGAVVDRLKEKLGDNVVRVNTVGTMKVKGAIKDVSRILLDTRKNPRLKEEVDEVCKSIGVIPQGMADTTKWLYGYTDMDGNSHPGEVELNGALADFFEQYPEVERGVMGVLDIPRSIGRHASAFCVAEEGIRDIIPICRVKGQECTQFTMGPVEELGLVKMDFLGLNTLKDIGRCVEWIKKLRGKNIDPYDVNENNAQVWAAFGRGKNETVFQFNGKIGVELCRRVKPRSVEDLAQITSAGRPGTLDALMPDGVTKVVDQWVEVKRGESEPSFVHESIQRILESTGGVCLFQEQISAMFQVACGYSEEQADEIREIVGKKKKDKMDQLIPELRRRLADSGWNEIQAESFISLCNAAANYSFNKCLSPETTVRVKGIGLLTLEEVAPGMEIWSMDLDGNFVWVTISDVIEGEAELHLVELSNGKVMACSMDHKFRCEDKEMHPLKEVISSDLEVFTDKGLARVTGSTPLGKSKSIDLEVNHPDHQFLADGVLVSNSHACSYSYIAYVCQYLKTLYPLEWWTSVLQNSSQDDMRENARFCADLVHKPDVNMSDLDFFVADMVPSEGSESEGRIIYPLRMVRGVGTAAESIIQTREEGGPFLSMEDFYNRVNRTRVNVGVVANLIYAGAFDTLFGSNSIIDRNDMIKAYGRLRGDEKNDRYERKTKLELMNVQAKVLPLWAPDYVSYIRQSTPMSVSCPSLVQELPVKSGLIIGGIVRSVRQIKTKKGYPMCFLTLGNRNEIADVTVFPALYMGPRKEQDGTHAEDLQEGEVLFIDGKVNEYAGKRSMIAEQIWYFSDTLPGEPGDEPNPLDEVDQEYLHAQQEQPRTPEPG